MESEIKIAVIGLGYVGLPLARLFSTKYKTVGFDMNKSRVNALMAGHDATLEVSDELLQSAIANGFKCTADIEDIRDCNFYVVAVPTPVDHNHNPDLTPLYNASTTVGKVISKGDIVVYESTVYPGVTEDECIPVVERISGLKFNTDFFAGYSPERINPGASHSRRSRNHRTDGLPGIDRKLRWSPNARDLFGQYGTPTGETAPDSRNSQCRRKSDGQHRRTERRSDNGLGREMVGHPATDEGRRPVHVEYLRRIRETGLYEYPDRRSMALLRTVEYGISGEQYR